MDTKKVVLITGASNGMGYEAAQLFAKAGWQVVAGARRVEKIPTDDQILPVKVDVSKTGENQAFVQTALDRFGRIDVLINNAGYGEFGPTEEIPLASAKYQFDVNYFAAVELANLVLPIMRQQQSGRIINISSIGGNVYIPLGAHYHATKAALQQWSDVLDTEIRQFNLRSIIIQPGGTASAWGEIAMTNAVNNMQANSPYQKLVQGLADVMSSDRLSGATSLDLAKLFYKAATDPRPKRRYYHSVLDHLSVWAGKNHPKLYGLVVNRLVYRMINK